MNKLCLFPFNCHMYKFSNLLYSCMTYGQKILKSYFWYPKLTIGKFVSNSCDVSYPAWSLQKMTLNMSKYELWSLHEFSHKLVKKTISVRPFIQVIKVLSPWIEDWNTNQVMTILRNPDDAAIRWGILKRKLWYNCHYFIVRENWLTHQQ